MAVNGMLSTDRNQHIILDLLGLDLHSKQTSYAVKHRLDSNLEVTI